MMEISKGLRKEIMLVQNKLKNAIRDHQICMGKLEDNSNNADILRQIEEIRLHIISLGRCQKQVVQRLRKEVESFKAENANGAKVSIASLLGLNHNNNNNNSTNNNNKNNNNKHVVDIDDEEKDEVVQVKVQSNGIFDRRLSKENYEGVVRNGVITASRKTCAKERFRSETSCAEEDIIEVSDDEKSYEQHEEVEGLDGIEEAPLSEQSKLNSRQVMFLGSLGLITATKFSELQNKRAERKRRSTANPQFVYSNWDIPTKRKRHSYLQSIGNAPQTRQTTARLNGPSPPPSKSSPPKSTSPPTKSAPNSLISAQKSTTVRPNILRNVSESQDSVNKVRHENGISELPTVNVKSSKAKTMHIPGLPSCLTIERIENDTAVCIYCRNPGTLTFCDNCSISYHASCRSSSPPPLRLCSKCVQSRKEDDRLPPTTIIKNDEELAPESSLPGLADKAGKDPEVNKTSGGFYKIDATASARFLSTGNYGINHLPTSTYLIPIASGDITSSTNINSTERQSNITSNTDSTNSINIKHSGNTSAGNVTYPPLIVDQFSNQQQCLSSYPKPIVNAQTTEKQQQQSFLVIKKISDPSVGGVVSYRKQYNNQSYHSHNQQQNSRIDYTLPMLDSRGRQQDLVRTTSLLYDHLASSRTESTIRSNKKPTTRTIPGLKPIAPTEKHSGDGNSDNTDCATVESTTATSADGQKERYESGVIGIQSIEPAESQSYRKESTTRKLEQTDDISQSNRQEKSSNLLNALLASDYKSDTSTSCVGKPSRNNFNNFTSESIADRLYRRLSQDQSCTRRAGDSTAKFAEHVKLEEAHLSAPSPTNLVQYKLTDNVEQNQLITRPKSCPIVDAMVCDKRVMPRILMRNGRRSLDSLQTSHGMNITGYDVAAWKRVNLERLDNIDEESMNKSEHMETSVLDDTLTATEGECDEDDRDDGDDDEATDSPDDIDDEKIVSNIDMQVLEDFESAMMEVNQDDTAN